VNEVREEAEDESGDVLSMTLLSVLAMVSRRSAICEDSDSGGVRPACLGQHTYTSQLTVNFGITYCMSTVELENDLQEKFLSSWKGEVSVEK
jgi:hypothetical protein